MEQPRKIRKVFKSKPTIEGAGVHLHRAMGFSEVPLFDPFLLLDDFRADNPQYFLKGFPWHPHRGIETITYVLQGDVEHGDSLGNSGIIGAGDVQWMTAGSGIIHQEMPKGDSQGIMSGFQLWANLSAAQKMTKPYYRGITANEIPEITVAKGVVIRVICGKINGTEGPVRGISIDPEYLDISVSPHSEYVHRTSRGHKVFAYIIEGKGTFCGEDDPYSYDAQGVNYFDMKREHTLGNQVLILFSDGDMVTVRTTDFGIRMLLISGKPLNEPIAWYGPIVMNTNEELEKAYEDLENGTFIQD